MASRISKKLIRVALIIAMLVLLGVALSCDSSNPSDLTLPIITWNETSLSAFEGTPVVLNFWSISCTYCRQQLPYLENVAQESEGAIKVIAVNIVDNAASVQKFFGDYEPAMIIALDTNREAFANYCLAYNNTRGGIPFTLFVDSEGVVQYARIGAFSSETQLWDTLNDVLGITVPQTS
jgi:thiol-disulfide isomerase/thioredoxin